MTEGKVFIAISPGGIPILQTASFGYFPCSELLRIYCGIDIIERRDYKIAEFKAKGFEVKNKDAQSKDGQPQNSTGFRAGEST